MRPLARPKVGDVRAAAGRFKLKTKVGIDGLNPRDLADATDDVIEA